MGRRRCVTGYRNGGEQAVRIPREFDLQDEDALVRPEGDAPKTEPPSPPALTTLLATLQPIDQTFSEADDRPPAPVAL